MKAFALSFESVSVKEALREAVNTLQKAHIESASLDARLLLEHAMSISREQLLFKMDESLSPAQTEAYRALVTQRATRRPMAQIIGKREFFGLSFEVTPAVLDPRPDSETLVEAVLKRVKDKQASLSLLDLGTGSGCLLLALLYELKNTTGTGVDLSEEALKVAYENAMHLGLKERATFIASHWCMQVEGEFDIIVSNPPYIPTHDIADLQPEVSQFEPKLALDGGADGLSCYRAIIASLPKHLAAGGLAAVEIGIGQQQAVEALITQNGLKVSGIAHDLHGIARCILITHQN